MKPEKDCERWMRCALEEAQKAFKKKEVPVGAVVVYKNKIVARAHNLSSRKNSFLQHAEFLALQRATKKLGRWKVQETALYVTLEPCAMCAGAIVLSRLSKVFYGAKDPKAGADGSALKVLRNKKINFHTEVVSGILQKECGNVLTDFFKKIRDEKKKRKKAG